jgi:hypothetical protein
MIRWLGDKLKLLSEEPQHSQPEGLVLLYFSCNPPDRVCHQVCHSLAPSVAGAVAPAHVRTFIKSRLILLAHAWWGIPPRAK